MRKKYGKLTHILFLLDESGSMGPRQKDVIGGFNSYLDQLRGDGNLYTITTIKFSDPGRISRLFEGYGLSQIFAPRLTEENYQPAGNTALYDAIGQALSWARIEYGTTEHPCGEGRFICIIMTDGEENSSRTHSKQHITAMIERHEKQGNWTFVYMGADQDAWQAASSLGFAPGNVLSYNSNDYGKVFRGLATSTNTSATMPHSSTTNFFSNGG